MTVSRRARNHHNTQEASGYLAGGGGTGSPAGGEGTPDVRVSLSALYEKHPEYQECISVYDGSESINKKLTLQRCDITELHVDAIACSVQDNLIKPSHGLCKHVWDRGGNQLKEHCKGIGYCSPGTSFVTPGFNLPAKYVIHTAIPPPWNLLDYNTRKAELKRCYLSCLQHVRNMPEIQSVALPCLGSGAAEIQLQDAITIAVAALREWLNDTDNTSSVETIVLCMFDQTQWDAYLPELAKVFPYGKDYAGLDLETLDPVDIDILKLPEYAIASNILCYKYKPDISHTITRHFHKMANTSYGQLPGCNKPPNRHRNCVTFHLGGQGHHQLTLYHSNTNGTIEIRVADFSGNKESFSMEICEKVKHAVTVYLNTHLESVTSFSGHIRCERTTWGESEKLWPMKGLLALQRDGKEHPCFHDGHVIGETHLCNPASMLAFWSDEPNVPAGNHANGPASPHAGNQTLRASGPREHDDGIHEVPDPTSADSTDIEPDVDASTEKTDNCFDETGRKELIQSTSIHLGHIQKLTKAAYPKTTHDKLDVIRSNSASSSENTCDDSLGTDSDNCDATENEEFTSAANSEMSSLNPRSYQEMSYTTFDDNYNRGCVKNGGSGVNKSSQLEEFLDHSTNLKSFEDSPGYCDRRRTQQTCTKQSNGCKQKSNPENAPGSSSEHVPTRTDNDMCETLNIHTNCSLLSASTNCGLTVSYNELQCQNTQKSHKTSEPFTYCRPNLQPYSEVDPPANVQCSVQQYYQHTDFKSGQESSWSNAHGNSYDRGNIRELCQHSCPCSTCLSSVLQQTALSNIKIDQNAQGDIEANQTLRSDMAVDKKAHSDKADNQNTRNELAANKTANSDITVYQMCTKSKSTNQTRSDANLNNVQFTNMDVINQNGVEVTNEVIYNKSSHPQRPTNIRLSNENHNSSVCSCQNCNEGVNSASIHEQGQNRNGGVNATSKHEQGQHRNEGVSPYEQQPTNCHQHFPRYWNYPVVSLQAPAPGYMLVPTPHTVTAPGYMGHHVPIPPNPALASTHPNIINGTNLHAGLNYGNFTCGMHQGRTGPQVGHNHVIQSVPSHHAMLSERNLIEIARWIGIQQLHLGLELGVPGCIVEQIQKQNSHNIQEQGYYIMKEWINMNRGEATPAALLEHMERCNIDTIPIRQILGVA